MGVEKAGPVRDFPGALTRNGLNVIAELKKASPSRGVLRAEFDAATLAAELEQAGAAALSVLTEEEFFHGDLNYMRQARKRVALPSCARTSSSTHGKSGNRAPQMPIRFS